MRMMTNGVLLDRLGARESATVGRTIKLVALLFMTALTAAAAQVSVSIPFTTVPLTLQPTVVLLTGMTLGWRLGAAAQVCYLAAGIAGLPVFAASLTLPPGAGRLLGPTGGYLLAYPLAAFVAGWLAERGFDRRYATSVLAMLAGLAVIYVGGISWLAILSSSAGAAGGGWQVALATGFYPFILADVAKVVCAAAMLPGLWRLLAPRAGH